MGVPQTTVVIPHYRADTLCECLAALAQHTDRPVRVVVVDDGGDGPALRRARAQFPDLEVLRTSRPAKGFLTLESKAIEQGTRSSISFLWLPIEWHKYPRNIGLIARLNAGPALALAVGLAMREIE